MRALFARFKKEHPFALSGILFVALAAITLGIGVFLERTIILQGFDRFFYELGSLHPSRVVDLLVGPFNRNFLPFGFTPSFLDVWLVLLILYVGLFKRNELAPALISIIVTFAMSLLILYLNTRFVFRMRPYTVFPNIVNPQFKAALMHFTSWPSGHVRDTAIMATLTVRQIPSLKWPAVVFALFIAFSRVYVGAHYPTDVIGGLLLGWALAELGLFVTDSIMDRRRDRG